MRWWILGLTAAIGVTGCAPRVETDALCAPLRPYVANLRTALEAHPETPHAVGEAGTDVVIGYEGGCLSYFE